jgi:hypothetical protein
LYVSELSGDCLAGAEARLRFACAGPMSMYAIVKDPRRGERQVGDKPRAQMNVRFIWQKGKSKRPAGAAKRAFG